MVDTIGFQDQGWLDGNKGHPQTDAMHVAKVEREIDTGAHGGDPLLLGRGRWRDRRLDLQR